ncbi:MAG: MCE family protein [Pelagibacterales bacterium]|nr:MCE family protein [Pelagibacterales bacterium]
MNKELKIGFVALLAIVALFIGVNYLKGLDVLNPSRKFYAKYENIGGLKVGSSVFVNGYQVGMVSNIDLLANENQQLLVTISIEKDFDIPKNSILKIVNQDLMGTKSVNLILGDAASFAVDEDTLISGIEGSLQQEVSAQILPLKIKTEELIGSIDSVMKIITAILDKDARENLSNSLQSLDQTFLLMNQSMIKVNQIVDQNDERISSIVKNLEANNDEITNILKNFSNISDDIAQSNIKNLLTSLSAASKKINDSEGSLGMLINDKDLYLNLEKSSKELEALIKDIKANPKRYVSFSIIGGSTPAQQEKK